MSVLKKRVNTKITIAILSLEVFAALLSLFLIVYPNINVKPIKASTTIPNGTLQLNGSTNPSSIASDATVTINWDPTQFKDSSGDNSPVQVYACYNSSTNNIGDFSNCMVKEWPHFENTGSYQFSIADSMIPNPRNCYRNEKLFTIGITKFSNSGVTAISSKVSITGIKAPGICPTAPTIISITLLNNTWFGGMAKQVSIFGSNLNYPGLDIKICNPNNSNTCLPLSIDPSTYYCISSVGCFFTTSAIGTNLTDISSNGSSILKVCTKTTIPSCQTSIFTYYPASNPAITTAPTISKLKLATNSWQGGTTNTIEITGSNLLSQSGFNINLCNPDHPNYCMIASLSSTINSCSATSCTLTTSAIGGNLTGIGNNNNVFFSGQTTILKVCPKSAFIPSCWAIPFNYTPAGAPAITDFTLGNNSWQGGATNTINIAGSNLNLLPQQGFNLNICNPTILDACMPTTIGYTTNSCSATSCTLTTSAIGSSLTDNINRQYFNSIPQANLKICTKTATPSCLSKPFTYVLPTSLSSTFDMPSGGSCMIPNGVGECVCISGVRHHCGDLPNAPEATDCSTTSSNYPNKVCSSN